MPQSSSWKVPHKVFLNKTGNSWWFTSLSFDSLSFLGRAGMFEIPWLGNAPKILIWRNSTWEITKRGHSGFQTKDGGYGRCRCTKNETIGDTLSTWFHKWVTRHLFLVPGHPLLSYCGGRVWIVWYIRGGSRGKREGPGQLRCQPSTQAAAIFCDNSILFKTVNSTA